MPRISIQAIGMGYLQAEQSSLLEMDVVEALVLLS